MDATETFARDIDHLAGFLAGRGLPFRLRRRRDGLRWLYYRCPLLGEKVAFEVAAGGAVETREIELPEFEALSDSAPASRE